jgi:hypothetical protein
MQTRPTVDPLQQKTWEIDNTNTGLDGFLYYCVLCDEALVLSKQQINLQKIQIAFNNTCPGCNFELDRVLGCRFSTLPTGRRLLTNLKCRDASILLEPEDRPDYKTRKSSSLPRDFHSSLATGMEAIDRILVLKKGQLVFLQGEPSHAFSLLLCARATLPQGLDSNIVFIDAGNLYDTYTVAQHAISLGLDNSLLQERIHLSRAFTHHQVYSLIMEKLPIAREMYGADFAIVSDITALFCDPDVRDKKESLDLFRKSIQFLSTAAENENMLIVVTNLKKRSKAMEDFLTETAHVSVILRDRGDFTQLTVARHPFLSEKEGEASLDNTTLAGYSTEPAMPAEAYQPCPTSSAATDVLDHSRPKDP